MPDPQPNAGNTGNPNPDSGQQAPANQPGTPEATGQTQTPPEGVNLQGSPEQTPAPGEQGGSTTVPLTALQEEREKRQALQQELEQVKQFVAQSQARGGTSYEAPQEVSQAPQAPNDQYRDQINKLWETDPREAVKAEIDYSLATYDTINAQIEAQANQLAGRYADFNNYRQTAMNYIRTLPYSQRAQNGIVELAYMVARGQNVDTLLQSREQELMEKFKTGQLASSIHTPAGASGQANTPSGQITLSPDQQAAARAMNLSDEQYASQIKGGA